MLSHKEISENNEIVNKLKEVFKEKEQPYKVEVVESEKKRPGAFKVGLFLLITLKIGMWLI